MAVRYEDLGKRALDVTTSTLGLLVASPAILLVAGAILVETGRPVLFIQERVGRDGRLFRALKFRSMKQGSPSVPSADGSNLSVTRVGRVIRRLSLDELPQLVNILVGDMSLVGPRPAIPSQTELLDLRRSGRASSIRPGLTGLAQVCSYDGMSDGEKARFDNEYAEDVTFISDVKVVGRTFTYLLQPPPVY